MNRGPTWRARCSGFSAALALLAVSAFGQTRGPANAPGPIRTAHSAAATLGANGEPDSWFVVRAPDPHQPLIAEESIVASVTLPDGRVFTADFSKASMQRVEASDHERTTLRWAMFERAGEPKKILGAHLFATTRADRTVEYTCVFSNGACKPGVAGSFCGAVYLTDLRIEIRDRLRKVYADTRAGESITNNGRAYVITTGIGSWIPPRGQFTRRFVSYQQTGLLQASEEPKARAVLALDDLVLPEHLENVGTQKIERTREASSATLTNKYAALRSAIKTGAVDPFVSRVSPSMGIFQTLYDGQPGEVGGAGIVPVAAPEFSIAAARWHRLAGDCVSERMPIAAYDTDSGVPLTPDRWALGGSNQGFEYRSTRGWDGIVQIPEFAASSSWQNGQLVFAFREFNSGSCAWRSQAIATFPVDGAHLSRASKDDQASWFLTHDWASWLRIRMLAADTMCVHTLRGKRPLIAEYEGQWVPYSLEKALRDAKASPGHGGGILRELGWSMDALAFGGMLPGTGREHYEEVAHARGMLDLARTCVLPNGIAIDGRAQYGSDNGIPWQDLGLPVTSGEAPEFQVTIYDNGIYGLTQLVGPSDPLCVDTANRTIVKACERFFTVPFVRSEYGGNQFGPGWYLVTSENGVPCVPITKAVGNAHIIHDQHDLALAFLVSGEPRFLDAMAHVGFAVDSPKARLAGYRATKVDREWIVLPQAVLESAVGQ